MVTGTSFWPESLPRQPANIVPVTIFLSTREKMKISCRSLFISAQPIFIIQAKGYYLGFAKTGRKLGRENWGRKLVKKTGDTKHIYPIFLLYFPGKPVTRVKTYLLKKTGDSLLFYPIFSN